MKYRFEIRAGIIKHIWHILPTVELWTYKQGPLIKLAWLCFNVTFDWDNGLD